MVQYGKITNHNHFISGSPFQILANSCAIRHFGSQVVPKGDNPIHLTDAPPKVFQWPMKTPNKIDSCSTKSICIHRN